MGGEGVGVCPIHFVPRVLTPVMGECAVMVKGGCHLLFSDQGPLLKSGGEWEGSIRAKESFFLVLCLEVEVSLRAMRPTSSDAKLREEVGHDRVDRCILPFSRPFVVC